MPLNKDSKPKQDWIHTYADHYTFSVKLINLLFHFGPTYTSSSVCELVLIFFMVSFVLVALFKGISTYVRLFNTNVTLVEEQ